MDELSRRLQTVPPPGEAPGAAAGGDAYFRGAGTPSADRARAPAQVAPALLIETFELEGDPGGSGAGPRSGAEIVSGGWRSPWRAGCRRAPMPSGGAGGRRRLAGVSSKGDPRPVLFRVTGPAWTAAPSGSGAGTALTVDIAGCTVTAAAHGDLSSEKVYARLRTMTCAVPGRGAVIETEVAGFVAGSGKTGVRGPVVSREGARVENAFLAGMVSGIGQGVASAFQPRRWRRAGPPRSPTRGSATAAARVWAPAPPRSGRRSPTI